MIVIPDLLAETRYIEEGGEVTKAIRVFVVEEVQGTGVGGILYGAMANPSVPKAGDCLDSEYFPYIRVSRRTPSIVGKNDGGYTVRIEIEYELWRTAVAGDGEEPMGQLPLAGGATLNQQLTYFEKDGQTPLEVSFISENPEAGTTDVLRQRGRMYIPVVQGFITRERVIPSPDPDQTVNEWVNYVNSVPWKGAGVREWLCTNVQYNLVNAYTIPCLYLFRFEFERKNAPGWVYDLCYMNEEGFPIEGSRLDVNDEYGIRRLEYHDERDFSQWFV